jgi:hypothetical protein
LLDGLANVGFREAGGQGTGHGLAKALAGGVLLLDTAYDGRVPRDFHPGRVGREDAFPLQVGVGLGNHLGIGQQLLGEGAVFRQPGPGFESAGGDMGNDLPDDLVMNGHRGIVLNINHHEIEATADWVWNQLGAGKKRRFFGWRGGR